VITVETDVDSVERRLRAGRLACAGVLAGWGRARARRVRGPNGLMLIVPRRSRCTGCGVTHGLLPVVVLARRCGVDGEGRRGWVSADRCGVRRPGTLASDG